VKDIYELLAKLEFAVPSERGDRCVECNKYNGTGRGSAEMGPDRGHDWGCALRAHLDYGRLLNGKGKLKVKGMDHARGELSGTLIDFRNDGAQILVELEKPKGERIWLCSIFRPQF